MKYYKIVLASLSIILFCNLQGLSQFSSVRLLYINDYLQGDQLELSVNKSIKNHPISFELAAALTPDLEGYNVKFGANYYFNVSEVVNFSVGLRAVYAFFIEEFSGDRQKATYFDLPIRVDIKMSDRVFSSLTFIPTYNTFTLLNDKIVSQASIGFGYNFWFIITELRFIVVEPRAMQDKVKKAKLTGIILLRILYWVSLLIERGKQQNFDGNKKVKKMTVFWTR